MKNDEAGGGGRPGGPKYDLGERTAVFGENVIQFLKKVPLTPLTEDLVRQVVRSATSVGANYTEADDAESRKDFRHKINTCRQEAKELNLIFGKIRRSCE